MELSSCDRAWREVGIDGICSELTAGGVSRRLPRRSRELIKRGVKRIFKELGFEAESNVQVMPLEGELLGNANNSEVRFWLDFVSFGGHWRVVVGENLIRRLMRADLDSEQLDVGHLLESLVQAVLGGKQLAPHCVLLKSVEPISGHDLRVNIFDAEPLVRLVIGEFGAGEHVDIYVDSSGAKRLCDYANLALSARDCRQLSSIRVMFDIMLPLTMSPADARQVRLGASVPLSDVCNADYLRVGVAGECHGSFLLERSSERLIGDSAEANDCFRVRAPLAMEAL